MYLHCCKLYIHAGYTISKPNSWSSRPSAHHVAHLDSVAIGVHRACNKLRQLPLHTKADSSHTEQPHRIAHVPGKRIQKVSRNVTIDHTLICTEGDRHVRCRHWLPVVQAHMLLCTANG